MLKHLEIYNYALIEHIEINFSDGFSVITGETGTGKSIIMGALSLVLGDRADAKSVQEGKEKCIVEAVFDIKDYGMESFFAENDLDYLPKVLVRREVQIGGKSRAFINDTPVNLALLKSLSEKLIDIHSQHENLLLRDDGFQLKMVDSIAKSDELRVRYRHVFDTFKALSQQLSDLHSLAQKTSSEHDYIQFQFNRLNEAQLQENEQDELERELDLLTHGEEIKTSLAYVADDLQADEHGLLIRLKDDFTQLQRIRDFLPTSVEISERIESCRIELKDLSSEIFSLLDKIEFDPKRKFDIENRLSLIYDLQQKYQVGSVAELIQCQAAFEKKLKQIDSFDEKLAMLQKQVDTKEEEMRHLAEELTQKRLSVCDEMEQKIQQKLSLLGMPNAKFKVLVQPADRFIANGRDIVQFLFTANKNAQLQPINDIASGGEMSRVMLSIKSLVISKSFLPTIIFDEIDTGVSGEIAHRMGKIMQQISHAMQVITITHLPQIASKGVSHYKVYKSDTGKNTVTNISMLSEKERVLEIAEMLSGKNPSQAAMENAKELLKE